MLKYTLELLVPLPATVTQLLHSNFMYAIVYMLMPVKSNQNVKVQRTHVETVCSVMDSNFPVCFPFSELL
jgi:hypothetical protein